MFQEPFKWAAHTARVLSELFHVDIAITTTGAADPIFVKNVEALRYYDPSGGENYVSLGDVPTKYDFTLFLTDAHVSSVDIEYAHDLSRKCKVGAGYVKRKREPAIEDALRKVFGRYFYSSPERVAQEVGLYLKRLLFGRG